MKSLQVLDSQRPCVAAQFGALGDADRCFDCPGPEECEMRHRNAVDALEAPDYPPPLRMPSEKSPAVSEDEELVRDCLLGDQRSWEKLINKYKRLIYSTTFKYRATGEDAADIFQSVCIEMFNSLPKLRSAGALRSWLITVTIHQSLYWKRKKGNTLELDAMDPEALEEIAGSPEIIAAFEQEQDMREAMNQLPPRCAELLRMLFLEQPPVSYAEAARRLGLAEGSIGFIRGRALQKLRRILVGKGF
jgi:RNA polymerase sigma factor (sigma-70 family)